MADKTIVGKMIYTVIAIAMIVSMVSIISTGKNAYTCLNSTAQYLFNGSLCTNTSSYINASLSSAVSATNVGFGASAMETGIMALVILVLAISLILVWKPKK